MLISNMATCNLCLYHRMAVKVIKRKKKGNWKILHFLEKLVQSIVYFQFYGKLNCNFILRRNQFHEVYSKQFQKCIKPIVSNNWIFAKSNMQNIYRPWDQTNLVLNAIEKIKPVFLLSLMCMFPEWNGTKFWFYSFHLQN